MRMTLSCMGMSATTPSDSNLFLLCSNAALPPDTCGPRRIRFLPRLFLHLSVLGQIIVLVVAHFMPVRIQTQRICLIVHFDSLDHISAKQARHFICLVKELSMIGECKGGEVYSDRDKKSIERCRGRTSGPCPQPHRDPIGAIRPHRTFLIWVSSARSLFFKKSWRKSRVSFLLSMAPTQAHHSRPYSRCGPGCHIAIKDFFLRLEARTVGAQGGSAE